MGVQAPPATRPPKGRVQAIARAGEILDVLTKPSCLDGAALGEIASGTGLKKGTAANLLASLAALGLVEHDRERKTYRIGLRAVELGRAVQRRLTIAERFRPTLLRLCGVTRETVNLAVPYAFAALIVDSLEGTQGVRVTSYAGTRAAYHSTACGKAILAHMPLSVRREIYAHQPLVAVTNATITDADRLESDLALTRERGFAIDDQENEAGAICIAVPILDPDGRVEGAISIAGPVDRMSWQAVEITARALRVEMERHTVLTP